VDIHHHGAFAFAAVCTKAGGIYASIFVAKKDQYTVLFAEPTVSR
jgi:hypothetical protein